MRIILDSNLALLLVVGLTGRGAIQRHKRLQEYEESDFRLLTRLLGRTDRVILTPHVVCETSNLMRQVREPDRSRVADQLKNIVGRMEEIYVPTTQIVQHPSYKNLGVTDSGLLSLCTKNTHLLTADLDLYQAALRLKWAATNFHHHRNL